MNAAGHAGRHLLFFDGVCGLCQRLVQFVLRRDRAGKFRFVALQSPLAHAVLTRHGADPGHLDTMYLLTSWQCADERLFARSRAVLRVLRELGWPWRALTVASILPTCVLDPLYRLVARIRYRVFGRHATCLVPRPEQRERFLSE